MTKMKTIIEALLIFMTGVLFAYFTYGFFNSLLSAMDTIGWDGWSTISSLIWLGYFAILVLWILIWPAYLIFTTSNDEQ